MTAKFQLFRLILAQPSAWVRSRPVRPCRPETVAPPRARIHIKTLIEAARLTKDGATLPSDRDTPENWSSPFPLFSSKNSVLGSGHLDGRSNSTIHARQLGKTRDDHLLVRQASEKFEGMESVANMHRTGQSINR